MKTATVTSNRIDVVDALRGFAIMSIMLLHNLEHFDFYYQPTNLPAWMYPLDQVVFAVVAFLFSGKSYTIFALLFGFTFYLMDSRQQAKGKDFRLRFAWRMALLLLFGLFNSLFYSGDILNMYAIMGLCLIPVCRLSNKAVLWIAIIMFLQPEFWFDLIWHVVQPNSDFTLFPQWMSYFGEANVAKGSESFWTLVKGNMGPGKIGTYLWCWEQGRFFQTQALFLIGMLLGRTQFFAKANERKSFWLKVLLISVGAMLLFTLVKPVIMGSLERGSVSRDISFMLRSWANLSGTAVWVSGLVLLFQTRFFNKLFSLLIPFGRMSLTNYVMQSIIGAVLYYGFGLGLYAYTGASICLLIGITLFVLQALFCAWWLKHHNKGPLEALWHKGTWLGYKRN